MSLTLSAPDNITHLNTPITGYDGNITPLLNFLLTESLEARNVKYPISD